MDVQKKSVLIIEDHDSIRLLLGSMLSKYYRVKTLKDGLEGMAWLVKGNMPMYKRILVPLDGSSLAEADRTQYGAFAELHIPLAENFDVQAAGRYDHCRSSHPRRSRIVLVLSVRWLCRV